MSRRYIRTINNTGVETGVQVRYDEETNYSFKKSHFFNFDLQRAVIFTDQ